MVGVILSFIPRVALGMGIMDLGVPSFRVKLSVVMDHPVNPAVQVIQGSGVFNIVLGEGGVIGAEQVQ